MSTSKAKDTDFRKKWDKQEYAEKARQKDEEEKGMSRNVLLAGIDILMTDACRANEGE
jgi:hypothetical protein